MSGFCAKNVVFSSACYQFCVVKVTQARGSRDTPHDPWALVESGLRPIVVTLAVALFVHLVPPLVPGQALLGWIGVALRDIEEETDVPEQEVIVPIELDMFLDEDPQAEPATEPAAAPPDAPDPGSAPENIVVVPQPKPEVVPPPAPEAPAKPAEEPGDDPDEEKPKEEPEPKPKRKIRLEDARDAAGDNNVARAEHPNVNIYIAGSELRKRDLAPVFSDLLTSVPEWQMLLGGTDIDPIADFDHVLISTPHMRDKAKWIVARVGYNVPNAKMKDAIDSVAKRSKGKWLPDYALPVASIDNDRRKVVLIEKASQLVVLPNGAEGQIPKLEKVGRFPKKPSAGIFLDIVTPANAFKSKFAFPKSIQKLTLRLRLEEGGGFVVDVEMIDEDEEHAKKNAAFLAEEIEKIRPIPLVSLFAKKYFIGQPTFETEGEVIRATAPVSRAQVERIMRLVKLWLKNRETAAKAAAEEAAENKKNAKKKLKPPKESKKKKLGRSGARREPAPKAEPPKPKGLLDGLRERVEEQPAPQ